MPRARKSPVPNNNRTDLNVPKLAEAPGQPNGAPNVQPTGLPYGESQALHQAQAALPIRNPTPQMATAPNTQPPDLNQALTDARGMPQSPSLLTQPTQRPDEPITAGMATGPGPGPEVLNGVGSPQSSSVSAIGTLNKLAAMPTSSPDIRQLAAYANNMLSGTNA